MTDAKAFDDYVKEVQKKYVATGPKSTQLHKEAQRFMPGGDTRSATYYPPFPTFMERGEGCRLYDVAGNAYIDFANNYTSLIHGHAHPATVDAVIEQAKRGFVYGSPVEIQTKLAQEMCERVPSVERVRFANSGTEATLAAIRLARAHRRKYKLLKMEGGYHGAHDLVEVSVWPDPNKIGPVERPYSVREDPSIPPSSATDCVIAPFNNTPVAERIIAENHEDLAAIIVEPVQGACGMIPVEADYLAMLRESATKYGIPLIYDEVISFRLARGGCQEICGILPDLTSFGKIIGGGLPVGAVGGREDLMDLFNPLKPPSLSHSGTFNGSPVVMAAGLATLKAFSTDEIHRINGLGDLIRLKFREVLDEVGIVAQLTGMGSLTQFRFTNDEVRDYRSSLSEDLAVRGLLHLMLLDKGIFVAKRAMFSISTPMGEREIEEAVTAVRSCLQEMKPYIEKSKPHLVSR